MDTMNCAYLVATLFTGIKSTTTLTQTMNTAENNQPFMQVETHFTDTYKP
jgi:hypothetical protein